MKESGIHNAYFIGIGGIGMSALALFFKSNGVEVFGYDKVKTDLTGQLIDQGLPVIFEDDPSKIDQRFLDVDPGHALVVYTPAIPWDQKILSFFAKQGYLIKKRAEALAEVLENFKTIAVAGTHGKTTTCAILAHIMHHSGFGCNAFLGGIANNFNANLVLNGQSDFAVVEADEYDRSFLKLNPFISIVTAIDPDHLDIYGSIEEFENTFNRFITNTKDGFSVLHQSVSFSPPIKTFRYGPDTENSVKDYKVDLGWVQFDLKIGTDVIEHIQFALPGIHNAHNALAASLVASQLGISHSNIRSALESFSGVKRRFEYHIRTEDIVFIDDYAHHPGELEATISSVKELYPESVIMGIFQPHLFSRTRDFIDGFAQALGKLDKVVLLDIYPAREVPIPGIDSQALLEKIDNPMKQLVSKEKLSDVVQQEPFDVLVTLGAGDIDQCIKPIKNNLLEKLNLETQNG